jgi:hypothetical protein
MSIDMHQMVDLANEVQKERWDQMKGKYGFWFLRVLSLNSRNFLTQCPSTFQSAELTSYLNSGQNYFESLKILV